MVTSCDPSVALPFEDDPRFGKSKASLDDPAIFPSKSELFGRFDQAMSPAAAWVATLSDADLSKAHPRTRAGLRADVCKHRDSHRLAPR